MKRKNKRLLKFSLKTSYLMLMLLIGYILYQKVNAGAWQYFISILIAYGIIQMYFLPQKLFNHITLNIENTSRRAKSRHRL